ncbi:MAG: hypothetical protein PUC53_03595 [Bacteroidales bacterium]|nr:hypothetical protein [Bacteroidales bacterium]
MKMNIFSMSLEKKLPALILVSALILASCSTQRKIDRIQKKSIAALLSLADDKDYSDLPPVGTEPHRDTLKVEAPDGNEVIIMRAVRDENGEMVANDVITASYVVARFRNVAERHGKVDLRFLVTVPASLQDSKWQLRFKPRMYVLGDTLELDPVIITGKEYRRAQLRGYQQYERFLQSIVSDTSRFIRLKELEIFLKRNLPKVYELKTDTTFYSDERFASIYGVTEQEAVEHYTNQFVVNANRKKLARKDKMFAKYVKVPIVKDGLRLDTVLTDINGDFIYEYTQTINTQPKLKKAEIAMSGQIFEEDRQLYRIPVENPLTFYISSLSSFVKDEEKYLTQVIERSVTANSSYWIEFESGKSDVLPELGENAGEISRIKKNIGELLSNKDFDLDSITVSASCSPEGSYEFNRRLSSKRSASVSEFFGKYIKHYRDSVKRDKSFTFNLDDSYSAKEEEVINLRFIPHSIPENWERLEAIVKNDSHLSDIQKSEIAEVMLIDDPDSREKRLKEKNSYSYLREKVYPQLRTVRFDFFLHRKGMVKDTVHTTVLDSAYMRGVEAIKDRDYKTAVTLLRPYHDFNTAIAYCSLDYNQSALEILLELKKDADVNYMLAILYSRLGDESKAVGHYMEACKQNSSYVHRGNLDPEISSLMNKYELNVIEETLNNNLNY